MLLISLEWRLLMSLKKKKKYSSPTWYQTLVFSVVRNGQVVSHLRSITSDCIFLFFFSWPHVKWSCNLFPAEDTTVDHPAKRDSLAFLQLLGRCKTWPHARQPQWEEQHYTDGSVHLDVVTVRAVCWWYVHMLSQVIHGCGGSSGEDLCLLLARLWWCY